MVRRDREPCGEHRAEMKGRWRESDRVLPQGETAERAWEEPEERPQVKD